MKKTIEFDCECPSCSGTGLYVGFAEKDGAAVVCGTCKGKGWKHDKIEYTETDKTRKNRTGIKRVYEVNPGIGVGEKAKDRTFNLADFGGMPYEDWNEGKPFPKKSEMRAYTCPAWWYQSANYSKKPNWKECLGCGAFCDCENFKTKDKCWEKFDKEHNK